MKILLVEDDRLLGDGIRAGLQQAGFAVDWAQDGRAGELALAGEAYDAVVLDLGLPRLSGMEVLARARAAHNAVPVLILTARDTVPDRIAGLDAGADDYLVKPFALREVEARLNALFARRCGRVVDSRLVFDRIEFDPASMTVAVEGRPVRLSRKCLRLLETLMRAPNRVHSRAELEAAVWGEEQPMSDTLRSHMHMLRRALTDSRGHSPIETIHGIGYRFSHPDVRPA